MILYATSKNTGPTHSGSDPVYLVYLGSNFDEAVEAVGDFQRYEKEDISYWTGRFPDTYAALPRKMEREIVKYYMTDGWWYSIVKFEV